MPRVKLNKKAPDIETDDFNGKHFSLKDYLEKKWVLLVLNRGFS